MRNCHDEKHEKGTKSYENKFHFFNFSYNFVFLSKFES